MIYVRIAIELAATVADNVGLTGRRAVLAAGATVSALLVIAAIWTFGTFSRDTGVVAGAQPATTVAEAAPFAPIATLMSGNRAQVAAGSPVADAGPAAHHAANQINLRNPGRAETIRAIQDALRHAGCYEGTANGYWSSKTRDGMRRLLAVLNAPLPVDQPDPALAALLASNPGARCDGTVGSPNPNAPQLNAAITAPVRRPVEPPVTSGRSASAETVTDEASGRDSDAALGATAAGAAVAAAAIAARRTDPGLDEAASEDNREGRRASSNRTSSSNRDETSKPQRRTSRRRTANAFDGVSRNMNRNFRSLSRSLSSLFR
ncbi:MAG: hypothetical protein SH859_03520 [Hyphomicrobium aestuarii]|nr:hypothetical protein [Hyphomicrobium aestuarii]